MLSVDGEEHIENNPYDNYFESEGTFRDLEIDDHRLAPKDSIYSFWRDDEPYAVPHTAFAGGKVLEVEGWGDQRLFLYRGKKATIFESTRGWVVPATLADQAKQSKDLLELRRRAGTGSGPSGSPDSTPSGTTGSRSTKTPISCSRGRPPRNHGLSRRDSVVRLPCIDPEGGHSL